MDVNSIENQIVHGVRDWHKALLPGSSLSMEQQAFLQRLLLLLAHVGLLVSDEGYHYTKHSALPLVAYLNHGARVKIELSKELLYPLLSYLVDVVIKDTNPLNATAYFKPNTAKTSTYSSQTRAKSVECYSFGFSLGLHWTQLLLSISKTLVGQIFLTLELTGYTTAIPFPDYTKDKTPAHPFWQYQAYMVSQGKQLYLPTRQLAIKATLTVEELAHIKELCFDPQLIGSPPSEHAAKALSINHLINIFSRIRQHNFSPELQDFLADTIYPYYQAYLDIMPVDYKARRNFLLTWLGRKPHVNPAEIIKLHADLKSHAITKLSLIEQEKMLQDVIEPLMHACSRELMALSN